MNGKSAVFFFGSGISKPSEAPMVDGLTRLLLNGAWEHNRWRYSWLKDGHASSGVAKEAQDFVRILKENIDDCLLAREQRTCNYEDLYAAIAQIAEHESGFSINPLIARFVETIRNATTHLCDSEDYQMGYELFRNSLRVLAGEATELIQWVVYEALKPVTEPRGMHVLSEVAKAVSEVDIFTLNHDLLLEKQLRHDNSPVFTDGFSAEHDGKNGKIRWFDGSWKNSRVCVRLFKLHGSINWYCFNDKGRIRFGSVDDDFDPNDHEYAIGNIKITHRYRPGSDSNDSLDAATEGLVLKYLGPLFLTGSFFKERAYALGLFGELYSEFCARLRTCRSMICCGYGWHDTVINARLVQWLDQSENHRMLILHGDRPKREPDDQAWSSVLKKQIKRKQVERCGKWLSESSIADLEPYFQD